MSTLYRDYRPQKFSEVLGQNHIKTTIQNEIISGRLANAYLFCGPRAVGKTTLARVLAKAINCQNRKEGEYEPCNKCVSCLNITAGRNLDIVEIDAASNTGVDNVRENIIAFSRLAPSGAKFKVFIIDEVHMLSISAFNALLKIIEEPPAYVVFILCTTEIQKVPGTIISRCERFDFKRISVSEIVKKLSYIAANEKIEVGTEILEAVARRSGGYLRDAEGLLGQIFSLGDKKVTAEQAELVIPHYNSNEAVDLIACLERKDAARAVALVNNLADSGVNLKIFTEELISLLRKMILNKVSPGLTDNLGLDLGENLEKRLSQATDNLKLEQLLVFAKRFLEIPLNNKNSSIPQLPLEMALVELCFRSSSAVVTSSPSGSVSPIHSASVNRVPDNYNSAGGISSVTKLTASSDEKKQILDVAELSDVSLSFEDVMDKWPEFLAKIKKYNHSLSFVLQNCRPKGVDSGHLCLVFKYKFHQDRINNLSIKSIVENTLREVYGVVLAVNSEIDENLETMVGESSIVLEEEKDENPGKPDNHSESGLMGDLLKTFGGEVIT